MVGRFIQESGGGQRLAQTLVDRFGEKRAPLALGLTGFIIAIPVFFDVGLIILIPLVYSVAQRLRRSLLFYAIPLLAGLAITHAFIPPTPGPVAVAGILGADLGWVILWGVLAGIPAFLVGGVLFARYVGPRFDVSVPEYMLTDLDRQVAEASREQAEGSGDGRGDGPGRTVDTVEDTVPAGAPAFSTIVGLILLPLGLIVLNTLATALLPEDSPAVQVLGFVGDPLFALTVATLLTFYVLGFRRGYPRDKVLGLATAALEPVGLIILVAGAGGAFGEVLVQTGVGDAMAGTLEQTGLPLIVAAFVIAVAVRVSLGSATAAAAAAAGIVAPIVQATELSRAALGLVVIAIASGSTVLSHVNDSGFWLVNRYLGMTEADTLKTWTVMETILGVVGFAIVAVLFVLIA